LIIKKTWTNMVRINQKHSTSQIRIFGLLFGLLIIFIFNILLPKIFGLKVDIIIENYLSFSEYLPFDVFMQWPNLISFIILIVAVIPPKSFSGIMNIWIKFGSIIGFINSKIILMIIFYIFITPLGLFLRIINRNYLFIKIDKSVKSYRKYSPQDINKNNNLKEPY